MIHRVQPSRREAPRSTRHRSVAPGLTALLGLAAAIVCPVARLHAQDLSKYAASPISVFASSATAGSDGEDGIPATSASFPALTTATDAAGNVYFTDAGNRVRMVYVGGPVPALLQFALAFNATLPGSQPTTATIGDVYSVVNVANGGNDVCAPGGDCGDGGQAAAATLNLPWGLAFDSAGNLYISDQLSYSIRKVSVHDGTISTVAGDPLHSESTYNGDGMQAAGAFLTAPTFLAFDGGDNLFIADSGSNLVRRVDATTHIITTVAGDNTQPGVFCSDNTCGEGGAAIHAVLGAVNGVAVTKAGDIFTAESNANVVRKVDHATGTIQTIAGQLGVPCADSTCGGEGVAATQATLNYPYAVAVDASGDPIITDQLDNAIRAVLPDGTIRTLAGVLSQTPGLGPLTGPAGEAQFYNPINAVVDATGNLFIADINNNLLWKVNTPVVLKPQTITFETIPAATYGDPNIDLTHYASTDSGLALTFSCTGPVTCSGGNGATLAITGSGTVAVTASQSGNSVYAPAASVIISFHSNKAPLTVKADNISFAYLSAPQLPPLTYSYKGFVKGDTQSAVSGKPVLSTTATPTSATGSYPITLTLGTLSASNYSLTAANGTLTITGSKPQTITFPALPNLTYGAATFTLAATASSGEPVTYTASGPAELLGSRLTISGAGTVTVTATEDGDSVYAPAPAVTQTFQVAPAVLAIAAQPATRAYGQPNPAFTYSAAGFVSADRISVLSGAPAFTTSAASTSAPGSYPLGISQGTLFASNYTFTFTGSTLTVAKASQTIAFPQIPDQIFGGGAVTLQATSSSGLAVQYTAVGPARLTGSSLDSFNDVGTVTVTATQSGSDVYLAATPVSQSFQVNKGSLLVAAANFTRAFGADNPVLTYQLDPDGTPPPSNLYTGTPALTTTADASSAAGVYPIVVSLGTLTSKYFNFQFQNGTLTVLPPASFILTSNPTSITIPRGQARQITLTLTPVNDFVGAVTIDCTGLPAGVTCSSSPNALTTSVNSVGGVNPVTGTLTISAGAPIASAANRVTAANVLTAGWLWFPSLVLGSMLARQRRRLARSGFGRQMLLFAALLLSASGLVACGSSGSSKSGAQPGTTTIQVTGGGTSTSGPATASVALSVTIE